MRRAGLISPTPACGPRLWAAGTRKSMTSRILFRIPNPDTADNVHNISIGAGVRFAERLGGATRRKRINLKREQGSSAHSEEQKHASMRRSGGKDDLRLTTARGQSGGVLRTVQDVTEQGVQTLAQSGFHLSFGVFEAAAAHGNRQISTGAVPAIIFEPELTLQRKGRVDR